MRASHLALNQTVCWLLQAMDDNDLYCVARNPFECLLVHILLAAQEWTALAKMVFRLKPLQRNNPPKNKIRLACYRAIQTKVRSYISAVLTPSAYVSKIVL